MLNPNRNPRVMAAGLLAGALLLSGCNVHVEKDQAGHEKKVDIQTPMGALKVRTDDVDAKDVGVGVYPGAVAVADTKNEKDTGKANVNISTPWFGLKVVALKFETPDAPEKVLAFYENELKQFGPITRCQGNVNFKRDGDKDVIQCKGEGKRDETQLVVGSERRHRIVSVKKNGSKTEFALVYVNTRGEGDTL